MHINKVHYSNAVILSLFTVYGIIHFDSDIAKSRSWILLSGDRALADAADAENVEHHGTLWVYQQLRDLSLLSKEEIVSALKSLINAVKTKGRRLPVKDLRRMIQTIQNSQE